MLRLTGAPYFVLGSSGATSLRLRIDTPWDWRQRFKLKAFEVWGEPAGQPLVRWQAAVTDLESGTDRSVRGHVEVRWSHGRFRGAARGEGLPGHPAGRRARVLAARLTAVTTF